jgi:hypothetical protein
LRAGKIGRRGLSLAAGGNNEQQQSGKYAKTRQL